MGGQSTLTATSGTTIILTSSTGSSYATASITGGASVSITAPTTGGDCGAGVLSGPERADEWYQLAHRGGYAKHRWGHLLPSQKVTYAGGARPVGRLHPAHRVYAEIQRQFDLQQQLRLGRHVDDRHDQQPARRIKHRDAPARLALDLSTRPHSRPRASPASGGGSRCAWVSSGSA